MSCRRIKTHFDLRAEDWGRKENMEDKTYAKKDKPYKEKSCISANLPIR